MDFLDADDYVEAVVVTPTSISAAVGTVTAAVVEAVTTAAVEAIMAATPTTVYPTVVTGPSTLWPPARDALESALEVGFFYFTSSFSV